MTELLKVSYDEVKVDVRGFYSKSLLDNQHLESIGSSFLDGYHDSLTSKSLTSLCKTLDQKENIYSGFAYEGAAMGLVITDFFRFKSNRRFYHFLQNEGSHHAYMLHVGAGWAYAKLPLNIEKVTLKYDPLLRWLIIDGYGFHQAYFKTRQYVYEKKKPKLSPVATPIFYQGVGRCLWFIEGTSVRRITDRIKTFPVAYHPDLWAGIGLAAVYAGVVEAYELKQLKQLSGEYEAHLMQGAAFAAKARQRAENVLAYTEMAVKILTGLDLNEAALITDEALAQISTSKIEKTEYETWRMLIRDKLSVYETSIL